MLEVQKDHREHPSVQAEDHMRGHQKDHRMPVDHLKDLQDLMIDHLVDRRQEHQELRLQDLTIDLRQEHHLQDLIIDLQADLLQEVRVQVDLQVDLQDLLEEAEDLHQEEEDNLSFP